MIRIKVEKPNAAAIMSAFDRRVDSAAKKGSKAMQGRLKALRREFTDHIRSKLKILRPDYSVTGVLRGKSLLFDTKSFFPFEDKGKSGPIKGFTQTYVYDMPRRRGVQYGVILGTPGSRFSPPLEVLARWILGRGGFTYTRTYYDKKGKPRGKVIKPVTRLYEAKKVAYMMLLKRGGKSITNVAPGWHEVTMTKPAIQKAMEKYKKLWHYTFAEELNKTK